MLAFIVLLVLVFLVLALPGSGSEGVSRRGGVLGELQRNKPRYHFA